MELEEQSGVERVGERCEECGARLSQGELRAALEGGGPALCSVHAAEVVPLDEVAE
jgi:hypothetical protein